MKKFICVFLSLVLLCSCSSGTDVQVVNRGLNFKAHIFYLSEEYVCSVSIDGDGTATFKTEEGILSGFIAVCQGEKVRLSYEGKESELDNSLFSGSVFVPIAEMFSYFNSNTCGIEEEDNNYFVKGETSAGQFTLFVSPAGLPIRANIDDPDFSVDFYDVSVQKQS